MNVNGGENMTDFVFWISMCCQMRKLKNVGQKKSIAFLYCNEGCMLSSFRDLQTPKRILHCTLCYSTSTSDFKHAARSKMGHLSVKLTLRIEKFWCVLRGGKSTLIEWHIFICAGNDHVGTLPVFCQGSEVWQLTISKAVRNWATGTEELSEANENNSS